MAYVKINLVVGEVVDAEKINRIQEEVNKSFTELEQRVERLENGR